MTQPEGAPASLDLSGAQEITPPGAPVDPPAPLTGKERAGVNLAYAVLAVIAVFLLVSVAFLWAMESRGSGLWDSIATRGGAVGGQAGEGAVVLDTTALQMLQAERASFREFWLGMSQMVLLNLLLPVLTALLGYIFGTTQAQREAE